MKCMVRLRVGLRRVIRASVVGIKTRNFVACYLDLVTRTSGNQQCHENPLGIEQLMTIVLYLGKNQVICTVECLVYSKRNQVTIYYWIYCESTDVRWSTICGRRWLPLLLNSQSYNPLGPTLSPVTTIDSYYIKGQNSTKSLLTLQKFTEEEKARETGSEEEDWRRDRKKERGREKKGRREKVLRQKAKPLGQRPCLDTKGEWSSSTSTTEAAPHTHREEMGHTITTLMEEWELKDRKWTPSKMTSFSTMYNSGTPESTSLGFS